MYKFFKEISLFVATFASVLAISAPIAAAQGAPTTSTSDAKAAVCEGVKATGGSCDTANQSGPTVDRTVGLVVNILSFVVGVAAVIMIIIGGFKYIIASGDSGNIKSAKDTILYAIIGLVIVALAQVVVRFVLNNVSPTAGP